MPQATNKAEYEAMTLANLKIDGYGLQVTQSIPCPFCASPDFLKFKVLEVEAAMKRETVCKECGRGMKAIFTRTADSVTFEIMQTCGPDQPDWLQPPMRRVQP